jgi:hypothetical protein
MGVAWSYALGYISGVLLSIRWVWRWPGAMHSASSAWPSTQHQIGVAWSYALCFISLAFYSASDGCGLELCTLLHQPGPSTQHQMGVAWSYALCFISLAFYSASDGCGPELCTMLHQPDLLLSIRWVWPETMHYVASA